MDRVSYFGSTIYTLQWNKKGSAGQDHSQRLRLPSQRDTVRLESLGAFPPGSCVMCFMDKVGETALP
jgi:hypothetical protein